VLRQLPTSTNPNLLVGIDSRDDAGVFRLSDDQSLVQTLDVLTPIVDDPYAYGQIAAANSLSDIYAMGGKPITVMNIACFNPVAAPAAVWASVLKGAFDKTTEAGAVVIGGHSINDKEPKFGLSVTGLVNPAHMFTNDQAQPGDWIYLTKPIGTGIISTAAMKEICPEEPLAEAIRWMTLLNREASEIGLKYGVKCATDITGFGLAGHLYNVARSSKVSIEIEASKVPLLPGFPDLVTEDAFSGGLINNESFAGPFTTFASSVPEWLQKLIFDPQTSGGLVLFSPHEIPDVPRIGRVVSGETHINVA
jgi:selenide,water dikinase